MVVKMRILKVIVLEGLRERVQGLLGFRKAYPVLLKTRFGIHTVGLRFPIDVAVLDSDFRVVKITQNMKPNRVFFWMPVYNHVLELPAGDIRRYGICVGEKIGIEAVKRK